MAQAVAIGVQRLRQVALRRRAYRRPCSLATERSRCHPALPGSALARRSAMRKAVAIGVQRVGQVALGHKHIAHLLVGDREIALPSGIAGIGLGEALAMARPSR